MSKFVRFSMEVSIWLRGLGMSWRSMYLFMDFSVTLYTMGGLKLNESVRKIANRFGVNRSTMDFCLNEWIKKGLINHDSKTGYSLNSVSIDMLFKNKEIKAKMDSNEDTINKFEKGIDKKKANSNKSSSMKTPDFAKTRASEDENAIVRQSPSLNVDTCSGSAIATPRSINPRRELDENEIEGIEDQAILNELKDKISKISTETFATMQEYSRNKYIKEAKQKAKQEKEARDRQDDPSTEHA